MDATGQGRHPEELRRSESYPAEGQRLAQTGSWALNPSGVFDYWSPELFHIYGLDPAQGTPSLEQYLGTVHPQDRECMARTISHMLAESAGCDVKQCIVRPNGELRYIRCVGVPVVDNGVLKSIIGTAVDITDQEHLTQELQRQRAYLEEAQRLSHTGSFGWRPSNGEIVWSEETFRIFQLEPTTKPTVELLLQRVHPEDVALVKRAIERAAQDGKDFDVEHRLLMPDGSVKYVHVVAHALSDESGRIEFVGAMMDVTAAKQGEERIQQDESELRKIIETIPAFITTANPDGSIDFYSQSLLDYTGLSREEVLGRGWMTVTHPEDLDRLAEGRQAGFTAGEAYEQEGRYRKANGEYRWFLSRSVPLRDEKGNIVKWYGTLHDIEDRKRAEERIRQDEKELRQLVDVVPQHLFVLEPDGRFLHANRRDLEYTGLTSEDVRAPDYLARVFHPDDLARLRNEREQAIARGAPWEAEARIRRKDGEYRWFLIRLNPLRDEQGRIVRWYGTRTDIEAGKRAEAALREREGELRQVLDLVPQGVVVAEPDGRRLYANRRALDYFGRTFEEWRSSSDLFEFLHPDDRERMTCEVQSKFSSGVPHEFEGRLRTSDGTYRWFLLRYNPLRDERGRTTRWYVAATDIDDRKRSEERLQHENVALREEIDKASMFEQIVGTSRVLQMVLSRVSRVAPTDSTVLITGETGTGKELVARAIHRRSQRSSRAFVSVSCSAIPRDLITSELFGHEKGAFTGATQRRVGRFEVANGGTIFLDEVGELPTETQIVLLRVLQEREFERVGGTGSIETDVRVIAATNRDLQAAIAAGTFRSDLFYRLNVFPIECPPLRDRPEDISLLAAYFIDRYARRVGKSIKRVNKKSLDLLRSYRWPGNIRELQNVIERSVILCDSEEFSVDESWLSSPPLAIEPDNDLELPEKLAAQEKAMIEAALRESGGRVFGPSGAAARLGLPRSTLESKIRSLQINKNRFRTERPSKKS